MTFIDYLLNPTTANSHYFSNVQTIHTNCPRQSYAQATHTKTVFKLIHGFKIVPEKNNPNKIFVEAVDTIRQNYFNF